MKDLADGGVARIDLGSGYIYGSPTPSADGSRIGYSAGTRFLAPYLYDRATGRSERLWPENPPGFNELGHIESISPDDTHVAYTSGGAVYLLELATGKRQLISVDRWGGRNDLPAGHPCVNADGTVVAFESASPDLVEGDTNGVSDVFLRTVQ